MRAWRKRPVRNLGKATASAEVVAWGGPVDGNVRLTWVDPKGATHSTEVIKWWRLDQGWFTKGLPVRVDVVGREREDVSFPMHHVVGQIVLSHNPQDRVRVTVGDPETEGSWGFGVEIAGAVVR